MKGILSILIIFCSLASCTNPPYRGADVLGADEFVMDSYKIRDGKFSMASTLMVLGEVGQEGVIDLPNGFMTLKQALEEANGISVQGDKRYIQVIRGNMLHPKIYTLNWEHVIRLPSDSLLLMPGDIVYVAATPIAEWNRFVSQLLPTLIGRDLANKGSKGVSVNAL